MMLRNSLITVVNILVYVFYRAISFFLSYAADRVIMASARLIYTNNKKQRAKL